MAGKGPGRKHWQGPYWWQLYKFYPLVETEALVESLWHVEKWEVITKTKDKT